MTERFPSTGRDQILAEARRVVETETRALQGLLKRFGDSFVEAVEAIYSAKGRVIVSAVGKSGIIGRKIAATLTSTGTPALFLHPVEALHGDLGIVGESDIALLLSKSGESDELHGLLEYFSRTGVQIVALTGRPDSTLARHSTIVIDCGVEEEACPHDLAPTSSTTAALVAGDALAVALLKRRGFSADDFARFHPGGTLGRRMLLRVGDVMIATDLPVLPPSATMRECVVILAERRGTAAVVDVQGRLLGVVTAGDLTRLMERSDNFLEMAVSEVMTKNPRATAASELAAAAVGLMERAGIMALPVLDDESRVIGMVHLHDLMRSGVV